MSGWVLETVRYMVSLSGFVGTIGRLNAINGSLIVCEHHWEIPQN